MATKDELFAAWLRQQLEERGWTQRELARRAGISHVTVSKITSISDPKAPKEDVARKLADTLDKSDVMVFRLAGLLRPMPPEVEKEEQLLAYYRQLPRVVRELMIEVMRDIHKYMSVEANLARITEGLLLDDEIINDLRFLLSVWAGVSPPQREKLLADMVVAAERNFQRGP